MAQKVQVGVLRLTKPHVFRKEYACASWYTDIEVPAGEYPVYGVVGADGVVKEEAPESFPHAILPGTVIADNSTSEFGGWPVGKPKVNQHVGEQDSYYWYSYTHALAWKLIRGEFKEPILFELSPEFEVVVHEFVSTIDGQKHETARICRKMAA